MIRTDGIRTIAHYPARGGTMIKATKTGKPYLEWRAAQAWLAGYSDALDSGAPTEVRSTWEDAGYADDYDRGYAVGVTRRELRAA